MESIMVEITSTHEGIREAVRRALQGVGEDIAGYPGQTDIRATVRVSYGEVETLYDMTTLD